MSAIKVDSKEGFYSSLERRLRKKRRLTATAPVLKFTRLFYSQITLAEIGSRSWDEILDTRSQAGSFLLALMVTEHRSGCFRYPFRIPRLSHLPDFSSV